MPTANVNHKDETISFDSAETSSIKEGMIDDVLLSMYNRSDHELRTKIKQVFAARHPAYEFPVEGSMCPIVISASMLLDPSGDEKVSMIRDASKAASDLLGLNFLENPPVTTPVTRNDFVFTTIHPSAARTYRGLEKNIRDRFMAAHCQSLWYAAGGTCLFDDLPGTHSPANATAEVLGLLENEGLYSVGNAYICATGEPGNYTEDMLSAIAKKFKIVTPGMQLSNVRVGPDQNQKYHDYSHPALSAHHVTAEGHLSDASFKSMASRLRAAAPGAVFASPPTPPEATSQIDQKSSEQPSAKSRSHQEGDKDDETKPPEQFGAEGDNHTISPSELIRKLSDGGMDEKPGR